MICINEEQVREAVTMSQAMDLVERCLFRVSAGKAINHPRHRIAMQTRTVLHYMAGGDDESGLVGIKVYASNPRVGALDFVVLLFDSASAHLVATIEANTLGQIRTGAASGVATRLLARESACRMALFGSGFQAETQLEAVACARPLKCVRVYSRQQARRESFARRMSEQLEVAVEPAVSPEDALDGADIVTTVTNSRDPVFPGKRIQAGTHINAAGSNHVLRRELDADAVAKASLVTVDSLEQARMEAGDLVRAVNEGLLDWNGVIELSDVLAGKRPGRTAPDQVTLFESQGLAVEDIALAEHLYSVYRDGAR